MKSRNLLPAVLALTLAGPVTAGAIQSSSPATVQPVQFAKHEALSTQSIGLVGQYLRCRTEGRKTSAELTNAWSAFYPACDETIRKFARTFDRRGADVEDCVQDVWADLMTHLPEFKYDRSRGKFTSWLYTVVRSKATNLIRKQCRTPERCTEAIVADHSCEPSEIFGQKCDIESVRKALAAIQRQTSRRSFQVLHMRHIEGKSVSEVARSLDMKPGQVWVTEHRMKKKLANLLEGIVS